MRNTKPYSMGLAAMNAALGLTSIPNMTLGGSVSYKEKSVMRKQNPDNALDQELMGKAEAKRQRRNAKRLAA